jgi:hypothetical protein
VGEGRGWPSRVALRFVCANASKTSNCPVVAARECGAAVQHLRPGRRAPRPRTLFTGSHPVDVNPRSRSGNRRAGHLSPASLDAIQVQVASQ